MRSWFSTIYLKFRSIVSIQIFSFLIFFFCIIYLILSNFSDLSFNNIISQRWIPKNPIQIIPKQQIKSAIQYGNASFICDRKGTTDGTRVMNVTSLIEDYLVNILRRKKNKIFF